MCGIAGYLSFERNLPHVSQLRKMCDLLSHRGPDGYGYFEDEFVGLGHRRLSIIDVAGGRQPLGNEDGSVQVTFNGEIYNFRELRTDLIKRGHRFSTHSDTEVLVHLYEDVGERLPEYLRGMFALAIWDRGRRELFLARDRFGEKPLYYATGLGGLQLCFASELKALSAIPGFRHEIDGTSVADYLALGYIPDPKTIYTGVLKLPAGSSLLVKESGEWLTRYWTPQFPESKQSNLGRAIEVVENLAPEIIEEQLVSEVPLGAFLSGGVDSSAVVAYMAQKSSRTVETFSIGFNSKRFDELEYARLVAKRYSTQHREQVVTPSIQDILPVFVKHFDEPFADSSAIPTLYLAQMTRRHVTVALSGDGADEIFGGYRRYFYGVLEERIRSRFPEWFRERVFGFAGEYYPKFDYLPRIFRAKTTLSNIARRLGDAYFTSMSGFRDDGLTNILSPELRKSIRGYSPRDEFARRFEAVKHLAPLEQMQAVDYQTYLPGDILVKTDRATMAHSLESRAPWLDHRMADFAGTLPQSFKLSGRTGKFIFKKAVQARVPEPIITRPKMGFSVPLAEWFRGDLGQIFKQSVLGSEAAHLIDVDAAASLLQQHKSMRHDHGRKLWTLLALALWDSQHRGGRYDCHEFGSNDSSFTPAEASR
jgi:asparagine synthase (glutamine-hydrolysing)